LNEVSEVSDGSRASSIGSLHLERLFFGSWFVGTKRILGIVIVIVIDIASRLKIKGMSSSNCRIMTKAETYDPIRSGPVRPDPIRSTFGLGWNFDFPMGDEA
jgi:hypothetical protein